MRRCASPFFPSSLTLEPAAWHRPVPPHLYSRPHGFRCAGMQACNEGVHPCAALTSSLLRLPEALRISAGAGGEGPNGLAVPGAVGTLLAQKALGCACEGRRAGGCGAQVQGVLTTAAAEWPHIHISDSLVMADRAVAMAEAGCRAVCVLGVDFMSENVRAILDEAGHRDVAVRPFPAVCAAVLQQLRVAAVRVGGLMQ